MGGFLDLVIISVQLGALYGLVAASMVISFKFLNFPDLSVDGTFTLGAAVFASLTAVWSVNPHVALAIAPVVGAAAGTVTGLLSTRFRINPLLAGILVMTMLYSVNLRIMGRANISLLQVRSVLTPLAESANPAIAYALVFAVIAAGIIVTCRWFMATELGAALRFAGDSPTFVRTLGWSGAYLTVLGIALSNGVVSLCGALVAQRQGFADANMGLGILVVGLASLIIGDALLPFPKHRLLGLFVSAVVGSIGYQLAIGLGLRLGLAPTDLKLATGALVVLALVVGRDRLAMRF